MVASVLHGNGTLDEIAADPEGRARPASISVTAKLGFDNPLSVVWSTGAFAYDGAGNLQAVGADRFRYDGVSRLLEAEIVSGGATHTQALAFDGFGNLTSIANDGSTRVTDTSKSTNRLTTGSYDEGGNLTAWAGNVYTFDVLNRMTRLQSGGEDWFYVYDADDERIVATNADRSRTTWTPRGLAQEVVARIEKFPPGGAVTPTPPPPCPGPNGIFCDDFESGGLGAWSASSTSQTLRHTDYFWRGPRLLAAAVAGEETRSSSQGHT